VKEAMEEAKKTHENCKKEKIIIKEKAQGKIDSAVKKVTKKIVEGK